jgi:thymidine kinase
MGSSKTANALMVAFNYKQTGQKVLLLKPLSDTRDGKSVIKSRMGLTAECGYVDDYIDRGGKILDITSLAMQDCVIIDEAQFMSVEQVDTIAEIIDTYGIPFICYGLRTDFRTEFFPGSLRLMAIADKIEEVKTICWCGRKATCNARYNDNGIIRSGEQIYVGGNESYTALCRKHYREGKLGN